MEYKDDRMLGSSIQKDCPISIDLKVKVGEILFPKDIIDRLGW